MSYRCCKCKARMRMERGLYCDDEPCFNCGHTEFFWFEYYEHKMGKPPRARIRVEVKNE